MQSVMPANPPSGNSGVGSWIERRARVAPHDVALVSDDQTLTYVELAGRVRRVANGLRRLGVAPRDRVVWLGPNHPAFLESFFAAALLGAVMAPVNHRLEPDQIRWIIDDTEPSVVIHHLVDAAKVPAWVRHRVVVSGEPGGAVSFEALVADSADEVIEESVGLNDLCLLPHTTGTTGRPKGVMLTHGNVTWNVVNFLTLADFRPGDVTIAIAPFFRVGGTGVNVLPVLFRGGTVVVPGDAGPDDILRLTERHRVTVGFGNPDSLDALTRSPLWPTVDLSSIRFLLTGGAPVPERLIRVYLDRGLTLLQGYGLSEAAPLALLLQPGDALRKIGSAGTPPLLVDVRIVDPNGSVAAPGDTGELLVRGPNVMEGYWRQPEATRAAFVPGGWLRTGDAARLDDDGYVWIVDRIRDGFTSMGHIVYPGDVERVLSSHPAIADAALLPVPQPDTGHEAHAFVVVSTGAKATEPELLAFCRQRLAPYQVPAVVTFVDRLPRNSVGKLLRVELRALASSSKNHHL
jgi:fatty-acyl-CoA synthase